MALFDEIKTSVSLTPEQQAAQNWLRMLADLAGRSQTVLTQIATDSTSLGMKNILAALPSSAAAQIPGVFDAMRKLFNDNSDDVKLPDAPQDPVVAVVEDVKP